MEQDTFNMECMKSDINNIKKIINENINIDIASTWVLLNNDFDIINHYKDIYNIQNYNILLNYIKYFKTERELKHLEVIKYFAELYINTNQKPLDIHHYNEAVYRQAIRHKYNKIIRYLLKLHRKHKVYNPIHNFMYIKL
jgi:hypothetical protein